MEPIVDHKDHHTMILEQGDSVTVWNEESNLEGWVTMASPSGRRLLFWVPSEFRERLLMPKQQLVFGVEPVELVLSQFAHGPDWAKCYQPQTLISTANPLI